MKKELGKLLISLGTGVASGGIVTYSITGPQYWYWLLLGAIVSGLGIWLET